MAPGSRSEDAAHEREEEEEDDDEGVSDNPLPAWMEGDSLAPPCQADMDVVRAIVDFAGVTADDVSFAACAAFILAVGVVVLLDIKVPLSFLKVILIEVAIGMHLCAHHGCFCCYWFCWSLP